jgi:hypothetical protein
MVIITLPAYNEARRPVAPAREGRWENGRHRVIVVNTRKIDGTAAPSTRCAVLPVERVDYAENRGSARRFARLTLEQADDRDVIVTMDSDNTHTPAPSRVQNGSEGNDAHDRRASGPARDGVPFYQRARARPASSCGDLPDARRARLHLATASPRRRRV